MYISHGIVYAGEPTVPLKVECVEPLENFCIRARLSNGNEVVYDMKPLLNMPMFAPLKDEKLFNRVYLDYGVPTWNNGQIDLSPETIANSSVGQ